MRIKINGITTKKLDQRFSKPLWTDGAKDPRIRKRRKPFQIKRTLKRIIILALVLGFVGLHTQQKPQKAITIPVEAEKPAEAPVEPPLAIEPAQGDIFQVYFGNKADIMRAICQAESGLDTNAVGDMDTKYPSVGLCQIRLLPERQITMEQMKIPDENLKYAKLLYDKYGFKPWSKYNNGEYFKYLDK